MNNVSATAQSAHDRRQRRVLVAVALMFFAPLGVCFFLYYGHVAWRPGGRVNAGELVEPPRPLPSLALNLFGSASTNADFLKGKWTLLYLWSGPCGDTCRGRLYDTRQVRLALDRDMNRVQRVLLADPNCCDPRFLHDEHPDLVTVRADGAASALIALLPARDAPGATTAPRVYLVDPLGNLMMSYGPAAKSKGMLEDMKRLLRLSSIG